LITGIGAHEIHVAGPANHSPAAETVTKTKPFATLNETGVSGTGAKIGAQEAAVAFLKIAPGLLR